MRAGQAWHVRQQEEPERALSEKAHTAMLHSAYGLQHTPASLPPSGAWQPLVTERAATLDALLNRFAALPQVTVPAQAIRGHG
jgi:hypothetical protein